MSYYELVLGVIRELVALEPSPDSPDGVLLRTLIVATENYEREVFPIAPPTAEERAVFRAEQERE